MCYLTSRRGKTLPLEVLLGIQFATRFRWSFPEGIFPLLEVKTLQHKMLLFCRVMLVKNEI